MIDSIANFLLRLFDDFSLKRLFTSILVIIMLAVVVLVYERYTSNFELNRIQKSAEILSALQKIDSGKSDLSKESQIIQAQLIADLGRLVGQKPVTLAIPQTVMDWVSSEKTKNFILGAAPWLFILLLSVPGSITRPKKNVSTLVTVLMISLLCGWLSSLLQLKWSSSVVFILFLIVPLLIVGVIGMLAAIAIPQFSAYRMKAYNSSAIATLRDAVTTIEAFFLDHQIYPQSLEQAGLLPTQHQVNISYEPLPEDRYSLSASHEKGNKIFSVFSETNEISSIDK